MEGWYDILGRPRPSRLKVNLASPIQRIAWIAKVIRFEA